MARHSRKQSRPSSRNFCHHAPVMTAAIIVASGSSRRMGFDKLMAELEGRPVLEHSIRAFAACPLVGVIVVVTDSTRFSQLNLADIKTTVKQVDGGCERQHSVQNGLAALTDDCQWVAIHDGARPWIRPAEILLALDAAAEHGAASLAHPIVETLKRADNNGLVTESLSRENVWAMETPQCFHLGKLRDAYQEVERKGLHVTDEVSAFQELGLPVRLVANHQKNTKITFPNDLEMSGD